MIKFKDTELTRADLLIAGNTTGRDVDCSCCHEPWEDGFIAEDFHIDELNKYVILGPQEDDLDNDRDQRTIVKLIKCPSCDEEGV